ncbi:type II toxin-antitoxin system VapC family toxin [Herbiconiux daphne]|uniref:Ribonuclease VapC n=1 Tax=Herbiconiux daphne TaxID=2970914 RepID=A0ABT2H3Q8_9MICO|nr:type II toxin-antitoxin system VapC family toxin [Herbiconiux daphne]MCS5734567.1 type II toxin-antitoxin system VapC family toxin [Herbiconiux daphne]
MIYVDTNILVYLVESRSERGDAIRQRFAEMSAEVAISPLVVLECRVAPLRRGDVVLARRYDRLFESLTMLEIGPEIYRAAAQLRATHGLSTIDAIHLATAQFHLCDGFWTHDARLARAASGLTVEVV